MRCGTRCASIVRPQCLPGSVIDVSRRLVTTTSVENCAGKSGQNATGCREVPAAQLVPELLEEVEVNGAQVAVAVKSFTFGG